MDFMQFVSKEMLIYVVVLVGLGKILKSTSMIKDWLIPWILLIVSLGLCLWSLGLTVNAVVQAVIIVAAAVYSNQLVKQTTEGIKGSQPEAPKELKPTGEVTEFRK